MNHRRGLVWRLARPLLLVACFAQVIVPLVRIASSYRATDLGMSPAQILIMSSAFSVLPAFLAVGMGRYTDRHGSGVVSVLGSLLIVLSCAMLLMPGANVIWLMLLSAVLGLGMTLQLTALQGEVGMLRLPRHRMSLVGGMMFWQAIGQLAAPLILSAVALSGAPLSSSLALVAGGVALLAAGLSILLWRHAAPPRRSTAKPSTMLHIINMPGLFWVLLGGSLCVAVHDLTLVLMPVVGEARGIPAAQIGLLLALFAAGQMVARALFPRIAAKFGPRLVMVVAVLATGGFTAAVALPIPPVLLGAVLALVGLAMGFAIVSSVTLTMDLAPSGARATALGLRLAMNRVGQFLIPLTASATTAVLGPGAAFVLLALALGGTGIAGPGVLLRRK